MPLSALHILTLQQLKGVGTMTIYRLAEQAVAPIDSLGELSALTARSGFHVSPIGISNHESLITINY